MDGLAHMNGRFDLATSADAEIECWRSRVHGLTLLHGFAVTWASISSGLRTDRYHTTSMLARYLEGGYSLHSTRLLTIVPGIRDGDSTHLNPTIRRLRGFWRIGDSYLGGTKP